MSGSGSGERPLLWSLLSYTMRAPSSVSLKPHLVQLAEAAAARGQRGASWPPLQLAARAVRLVPLELPRSRSGVGAGLNADNFRLLHLASLGMRSLLCKAHPSKADSGLLALPLAAKAAAMLRLLAAAEGPLARGRLPISPEELASACHQLAAVFEKPCSIAAIDSPELLLQWGEALHTGLGLLRELACRPQPAAAAFRRPGPDIAGTDYVPPSLANLAGQLALAWQSSFYIFGQLDCPFVHSQPGRAALAGSPATLRRAARMLQQLHTLGCAAVHWAAAGVPAGLVELDLLCSGLQSLHDAAAAALETRAQPGEVCRPLQSLHAAHLEAMVVTVQLPPPLGSARGWAAGQRRRPKSSLAQPGLPQLRQQPALLWPLRSAMQRPHCRRRCSWRRLPVAAWLPSQTLLQQQPLSWAAQIPTCSGSWLRLLMPCWVSFPRAPTPQHLPSTQAHLLHGCCSMSAVRPLPLAQPLVAALDAYWSLPQQAAAARLELGLAVATRPVCANLRCPNIEAAASGQRGKRCASCVAVRWCSMACARAGWRAQTGPHKLACPLLASAGAAKDQADEPAA